MTHLYRCTEQEEGQVEEREARYQVLLFRHGPPMVVVLRVHHHHVDHETHDREAKHQAEQERVLPSVGEKETVMFLRSCSCSDIAKLMLKASCSSSNY